MFANSEDSADVCYVIFENYWAYNYKCRIVNRKITICDHIISLIPFPFTEKTFSCCLKIVFSSQTKWPYISLNQTKHMIIILPIKFNDGVPTFLHRK